MRFSPPNLYVELWLEMRHYGRNGRERVQTGTLKLVPEDDMGRGVRRPDPWELWQVARGQVGKHRVGGRVICVGYGYGC